MRRVRAMLTPSTVDWETTECLIPPCLRRKGTTISTRDGRFYLVARNERDAIVGIFYYRRRSGSFTICVHPEFRRRGIGLRLLREAMARLPGVDLYAQSYTPAGAALIRALLVERAKPCVSSE